MGVDSRYGYFDYYLEHIYSGNLDHAWPWPRLSDTHLARARVINWE